MIRWILVFLGLIQFAFAGVGVERAPACTLFSSLPNQAVINKTTYQINYTSQLYFPVNGEKNPTRLLGLSMMGPKRIFIAYDDWWEMESTVIHEIIHASAFEHRFPLSEEQVLALESDVYKNLLMFHCF